MGGSFFFTTLISFFLGGGIFFAGTDIIKRSGNVVDLQAEMILRNQAVNSMATLKQDSEKAKIYKTDLDNAFPNRDQLINFPKDMISLGSQNKITVNSTIGVESKEPDSNLLKVSFLMGTQGTLQNLVAFLNSFKNNRYLFNVKNFDLVNLGTGASSSLRLSLGGDIFAFQENQ